MSMHFIKPPLCMQLDYIAFVSQIDKSKLSIKNTIKITNIIERKISSLFN